MTKVVLLMPLTGQSPSYYIPSLPTYTSDTCRVTMVGQERLQDFLDSLIACRMATHPAKAYDLLDASRCRLLYAQNINYPHFSLTTSETDVGTNTLVIALAIPLEVQTWTLLSPKYRYIENTILSGAFSEHMVMLAEEVVSVIFPLLICCAKRVIITGHSIAGSVASLVTLFLMNKAILASQDLLLECISFGSPFPNRVTWKTGCLPFSKALTNILFSDDVDVSVLSYLMALRGTNPRALHDVLYNPSIQAVQEILISLLSLKDISNYIPGVVGRVVMLERRFEEKLEVSASAWNSRVDFINQGPETSSLNIELLTVLFTICRCCI